MVYTHRDMWISIIEDYVGDGTSLEEIKSRLMKLKRMIRESPNAGDKLDEYWDEESHYEF